MFDDASRRNDEALERMLRDFRRRLDSELLFETIGIELERLLASRRLIRDFFDRRNRDRRTGSRPDGA